VTSRWLVAAAAARGFGIEWKPNSLLLKNGDESTDEHREEHEAGHLALRVIARLRDDVGNDAAGRFYAERGYQQFADGEADPESAKVLSAIGVDPAFADAEDDASLDAAIARSMDEAHAAAGSSAGSPILAFDDRGYFGPVLTEVPDDPGALWDLIAGLSTIPEVHELKRDRENGPTSPPRPQPGE
jgi:hypothetical protein